MKSKRNASIMRMTTLLCVGVKGSSWVLVCESDRRVKRNPLVNKYRPMAWIPNTQTRTIKLFINAAGKNEEAQRLGFHPYPMSSYHIQDLRLVLPTIDFDLRVNKHCAKVSAQFREWLQGSLRDDTARAEEFSEHRFDLLCSLCFPTIDPTQLLRISKLCALSFLANDGHVYTETPSSQWLTRYVPCVEPVFRALNRRRRIVVQRRVPTFQTRNTFSK